jgi:hypothetical protein
MNLEDKNPNRMGELLRKSLQREEVPAGFADGVLIRAARQRAAAHDSHVPSWFRIFSQPLLRWAAFATISASLIGGGIRYREVRREREEGEAAKQQLMLALHIAGSKLRLAKSKVNEIHTSRPEREPSTNRSRSKS